VAFEARRRTEIHSKQDNRTVETTQALVAKVEMRIRKPVAEVFEAFIDPAITSKFWFTKGSGRLEAGKQVTWEWEMYGLSVQVDVRVMEPNRRIRIDWSSGGEAPTTVEWIFTARPDNTTVVDVTNSGFTGDPDKVVEAAIDSSGGFSLVLAGLKAWLEHGIQLNLVADRHPDGIAAH
jgi:uncharacterized protein YndB with AHSA1/START domain